jgi:hypothetical protein
MSSPNARTSYDPLSKLLIRFHQRASHGRRVQQLVEALAPRIPVGARVLDIGCGDMTLLKGLADSCGLSRSVGADIWPMQVPPPAGCEYRQIYPRQPFPWKLREFDVVLLIDTLHHAEDQDHLLREALRTGTMVLVKDHFEYGTWSRMILKLMDFVGNYGYGVPLPDRYFTPKRFHTKVSTLAPEGECDLRVGLDLYGHLPIVRHQLQPKWHFIAELKA